MIEQVEEEGLKLCWKGFMQAIRLLQFSIDDNDLEKSIYWMDSINYWSERLRTRLQYEQTKKGKCL